LLRVSRCDIVCSIAVVQNASMSNTAFALLIACGFVQSSIAATILDPRLTSAVVGGDAAVSWNASVTGRANIEYSSDLSNWITVSVDNSTGSFQHSTGNATKGFYQLKWLPTPPTPTMVTVLGGTLPRSEHHSGGFVATFQIGKYEVTWHEWKDVANWASVNGYDDLVSVAGGTLDKHPVRDVAWLDVIRWCNAKSEREGLAPVYFLNEAVFRTGGPEPGNLRWFPSDMQGISVDSNANGYRLPTESQWEWAALGGVSSQGFLFSGSNNENEVAWYAGNSVGSIVDSSYDYGRGTWPVGLKTANELGIHDMSGNVWEWCGSFGVNISAGRVLVIRGGSFAENWTPAVTRWTAKILLGSTKANDIGFRLARNAP